ncbi:MAG: PQQ-binding-like beta-propeller repeat protein [Planctomyces sp.]
MHTAFPAPRLSRQVTASLLLLLSAGLAVLPACASAERAEAGAGAPAKDQAVTTPAQSATPAPKADVQNSGDPIVAMGYSLRWIGFAPIPSGARLVNLVSVGNDLLVADDNRGGLALISASSGEVRWARSLASSSTKFMNHFLASGGLVSVTGSSASLLNIDTGLDVFGQTTGRPIRQQMSRLPATPPLLQDGRIVYATFDGHIVGQALGTGLKLWESRVTGGITTAPIAMGPNVIGVLSDSGNVAIIETATGTSLRTASIFAGSEGPMASAGDTLFIASRDQSVYAIGVRDGLRWRVRTDRELRAGLAYHDGRVYVSVPGVGLAALDAATGKRIWAAQGVDGTVIGIRAGTLIVWNGSTITSVDADGAVIDRRELGSALKVRTDSFVDGSLYISDDAGQIRKYSPR